MNMHCFELCSQAYKLIEFLSRNKNSFHARIVDKYINKYFKFIMYY